MSEAFAGGGSERRHAERSRCALCIEGYDAREERNDLAIIRLWQEISLQRIASAKIWPTPISSIPTKNLNCRDDSSRSDRSSLFGSTWPKSMRSNTLRQSSTHAMQHIEATVPQSDQSKVRAVRTSVSPVAGNLASRTHGAPHSGPRSAALFSARPGRTNSCPGGGSRTGNPFRSHRTRTDHWTRKTKLFR